MASYEQHLTRGLQQAIENTPLEDGKLRFSIDEARIFLDLKNERIEFTDFVRGLTQSEVYALENPLPKIYLTSDTYKFMVYHEGWKVFGVKGETGPAGDSAGFGTPSAVIVDDMFGPPSVEIETSGPDTAKVFDFTFRNIRGDKGDTGEGFSIYNTYPSIAEMELDAENVPTGKFVMIATDVEDPDNSKIYVKTSEGIFAFINDLSGAQGIQGPPGPTGPTGPRGTNSNLSLGHAYIEVYTAADETEKVASISDYELIFGANVVVKFINGNSANNATLNINDTGAKSIMVDFGDVSLTNVPANFIKAGETVRLIYDGTQFIIVNEGGDYGDLDNDYYNT